MNTTTVKPLTPQVLSRAIRAAGFPVSQDPRREGIRVSRGHVQGAVTVTVDFTGRGKETRIADELAEWLADHGYAFSRNQEDLAILTVARGLR